MLHHASTGRTATRRKGSAAITRAAAAQASAGYLSVVLVVVRARAQRLVDRVVVRLGGLIVEVERVQIQEAAYRAEHDGTCRGSDRRNARALRVDHDRRR